MRNFPELVCKLTNICDAWIIGSGADINNSNPRDYDIVVPFSQWKQASALIPKDAKPNSFGGWKCISEGVEVDVWPDELGWIMRQAKSMYAFHPSSGTRLSKISS